MHTTSSLMIRRGHGAESFGWAKFQVPPFNVSAEYLALSLYRNDTSRVFADLNEETSFSRTSYSSHFVRHNVPPSPQRALSAGRKNKPQPTAVSFLRQNPRFVCEPICHVETAVDDQSEIPHPWWPNEFVEKQVKKPLHSMDSTSRSDYTKHANLEQKSTRFSCNPNKSKAVTGIVPECDNTGLLLDSLSYRKPEKISYEHQYNSRLDPNQPVRGRRHGCFIWKPVVKTRRKQSMHQHLESVPLNMDTSVTGNRNDVQQSSLESDEQESNNGSSKDQLEVQPTKPTHKGDNVSGSEACPSADDKALSPPPHGV